MFNMHSTKPIDISVITTGGTIEKTYDEATGGLSNTVSNFGSVITPQLRLPYTVLYFIHLLNKDSQKFSDDDRQLISDQIRIELKKRPCVVVVHGTDTVHKTMNCVSSQLPSPSGTVVFTGAIRPAALYQSDARQNFCEALLASKLLPPGFYLSFHNNLYQAGDFRKNPKKGTFENL